MTVIAPCITVETPEAYQQSLDRLTPFAERVHIDVSDGEFAPTFLLGVDQLAWPAEWKVDVHAMVMRPSEYVPALIQRKPHLIVLHAEAGEDLTPHIQQIKQAGIKAGIALLKTTVPKTVAHLISAVDHVLIFSGTLGHYGGTASMMQLEKVRLVQAINPNVEIGWDGGASVENAYSLAQGGINVINVGGAIASSTDPQGVYTQFVNEVNKQGVV